MPTKAKKPRPHVWRCGPDEYKHQMYQPWMLARVQARFRGEEYLLSFEEYYDIWKDHWSQRGRASEQFCMTRYDHDGPWHVDNVRLLTRKEWLQEKNSFRKDTTYNKMKKPRQQGHPDYELIRLKRKKNV